MMGSHRAEYAQGKYMVQRSNKVNYATNVTYLARRPSWVVEAMAGIVITVGLRRWFTLKRCVKRSQTTKRRNAEYRG